jgi:hypothetical protein
MRAFARLAALFESAEQALDGSACFRAHGSVVRRSRDQHRRLGKSGAEQVRERLNGLLGDRTFVHAALQATTQEAKTKAPDFASSAGADHGRRIEQRDALNVAIEGYVEIRLRAFTKLLPGGGTARYA